jgi:hypothetical protein
MDAVAHGADMQERDWERAKDAVCAMAEALRAAGRRQVSEGATLRMSQPYPTPCCI